MDHSLSLQINGISMYYSQLVDIIETVSCESFHIDQSLNMLLGLITEDTYRMYNIYIYV